MSIKRRLMKKSFFNFGSCSCTVVKLEKIGEGALALWVHRDVS
jgi:hypothetical protein